jgi:NADH:ubiquinone oxidoreductase subunit C
LKFFKFISKSVVGASYGFFFYESTVWLFKKKQKKQIPFFYNIQTINIFNNIRWNFIILSNIYYLPSISSGFPAAIWSEREIQDMFTINFNNLHDTRRLLLDYKVTRGVLSPEIKFKNTNLFSSFYDLHYV